MGRFNAGVRGSSKTSNLAGGKAFSMKPKQELLHAVLSTFLTDKFYESGNDRITRIKALVAKVPAEFVAKLAVVARKEFHLRSVSHLLLGELSKIHHGDSLVMKALEKAIERPDDMTEIAAYLEGKLPKQVKRGFRHAILKFSPYSLAKYRMEKKAVKLVDVFNLVHPKPEFATPEQQEAWKALLEGNLISTDTWEARLSSGEEKAKVWRDLVLEDKIGYMALLRNLRNIEEQATPETVEQAAKMIADPERVKKSKQLPFRFYNAYENVKSRKLRDAIAQAMEHAVDNVPDMSGLTLVAVDTSGSMTMGSDPAIVKASILAAALVKKSECDVILFDTNVREATFNSIDSVMTNAKEIQRLAEGGGTETSLVFRYAKKVGKPYTRIIILSDQESWAEYAWGGGGVQKFYNDYRKQNDCYVYAIDIQGYGTHDVKGGKVEHVVGFSERIFDFILAMEKGVDTLEKHIDGYEL